MERVNALSPVSEFACSVNAHTFVIALVQKWCHVFCTSVGMATTWTFSAMRSEGPGDKSPDNCLRGMGSSWLSHPETPPQITSLYIFPKSMACTHY